jgi:hypothetical protein
MHTVHLGFTGTRHGMTPEQLAQLRAYWMTAQEGAGLPIRLHHGDCIGSDAQAHALAKDLGFSVTLHPPVDPRLRAYCELDVMADDDMRPPKPYLDRDRDIAEACSTLFATPGQDHYRLHSGTWYTVRYGVNVLESHNVYILRTNGIRISWEEAFAGRAA